MEKDTTSIHAYRERVQLSVNLFHRSLHLTFSLPMSVFLFHSDSFLSPVFLFQRELIFSISVFLFSIETSVFVFHRILHLKFYIVYAFFF